MANTTYETVQTGCSGVSGTGTNIIFIEKRRSFRIYNVFLTKMDAFLPET